jgi:hypothetical protein
MKFIIEQNDCMRLCACSRLKEAQKEKLNIKITSKSFTRPKKIVEKNITSPKKINLRALTSCSREENPIPLKKLWLHFRSGHAQHLSWSTNF